MSSGNSENSDQSESYFPSITTVSDIPAELTNSDGNNQSMDKRIPMQKMPILPPIPVLPMISPSFVPSIAPQVVLREGLSKSVVLFDPLSCAVSVYGNGQRNFNSATNSSVSVGSPFINQYSPLLTSPAPATKPKSILPLMPRMKHEASENLPTDEFRLSSPSRHTSSRVTMQSPSSKETPTSPASLFEQGLSSSRSTVVRARSLSRGRSDRPPILGNALPFHMCPTCGQVVPPYKMMYDEGIHANMRPTKKHRAHLLAPRTPSSTDGLPTGVDNPSYEPISPIESSSSESDEEDEYCNSTQQTSVALAQSFISPDYFRLLSLSLQSNSKHQQGQVAQQHLPKQQRLLYPSSQAHEDGTGANAGGSFIGTNFRETVSVEIEHDVQMEDSDTNNYHTNSTELVPDQRVLKPLAVNERSVGVTGSSNRSYSEDASNSDFYKQEQQSTLPPSSFVTGYYERFFHEEKQIGSGAFGSVFLSQHLLDGVHLGTYACKKIPVGDSRRWLITVLKEVRALESVHHKNVISYRHSWLEMYTHSAFSPPVPSLFLLMEYANSGTVHNLVWPRKRTAEDLGMTEAERIRMLRKKKREQQQKQKAEETMEEVEDYLNNDSRPHYLSEDDIWWMFLDTCLGLRHLHRCGVIHNDLKLENLLLTSDVDIRGRPQMLRVLISDMGNVFIKGLPYNRTGRTGTLAYCAPETLVPNLASFKRRYNTSTRGETDSFPTTSSTTTLTTNALSSSVIVSSVVRNPRSPLALRIASSYIPDTDLDLSMSMSATINEQNDQSTPLPPPTSSVIYNEATDLWSLGVILYALCFSSLPYSANTSEALAIEILSKPLQIPTEPNRCPELIVLIKRLLSIDPSQRPHLDTILGHPAIKKKRNEGVARAFAVEKIVGAKIYSSGELVGYQHPAHSSTSSSSSHARTD